MDELSFHCGQMSVRREAVNGLPIIAVWGWESQEAEQATWVVVWAACTGSPRATAQDNHQMLPNQTQQKWCYNLSAAGASPRSPAAASAAGQVRVSAVGDRPNVVLFRV